MSMTPENQTTVGWIIFIAAIGMLFGMISVDIVGLKDWDGLKTPLFVGTAIGHVAAVITAFVGGKLIPEQRPAGTLTRSTDIPAQPGETKP